MTPFKTLDAIACPLPIANADTDQLIPARFMSRPRKDGYGDLLLHGHRFDADGASRPDFPLNQARYAGATALVALRNFGSGSSREAAVYALVDFGFRCVIAPSFGDIFASNAVNNGLLPAVVSEDGVRTLLDHIERDVHMHVDLESQSISVSGVAIAFAIDPVWRTKLLNGWDDLDLTLSYESSIMNFFARDASDRPWVAPRRP